MAKTHSHPASRLPFNLPPRCISRICAAEYIGVSARKFDELVADNRMPRPIRLDGRLVWDRHALDRCIDLLSSAFEADNEWDAA
jgi:predicted DNA-binding transcriptional regulator AlpA